MQTYKFKVFFEETQVIHNLAKCIIDKLNSYLNFLVAGSEEILKNKCKYIICTEIAFFILTMETYHILSCFLE